MRDFFYIGSCLTESNRSVLKSLFRFYIVCRVVVVLIITLPLIRKRACFLPKWEIFYFSLLPFSYIEPRFLILLSCSKEKVTNFRRNNKHEKTWQERIITLLSAYFFFFDWTRSVILQYLLEERKRWYLGEEKKVR